MTYREKVRGIEGMNEIFEVIEKGETQKTI